VIFLTQSRDKTGVFDYLTKPFSDETLGEALDRVKVYLDEKKKQKALVNIYNKNALESSQVYYSKNDEKKLVSVILSGVWKR